MKTGAAKFPVFCFQNAFTMCNLTLNAVVSDLFGKFAADIENYLLKTDIVAPAQCVSLLRGSLKKKSSDEVEAVGGFNMTPEQKERVRIIQDHFDDIGSRITQLDEVKGNLVAGYEGQISLLCTILGIDRRTAITILSEIGTEGMFSQYHFFIVLHHLTQTEGLAKGSV